TQGRRDMSFVEVLEKEPSYPGYRWTMTTNTERMFGDTEGVPALVEVRGPDYIVGEGKERRFRSDVVAILRDEDAQLYKLLQWQNEWRYHSAVTTGTLRTAGIAWIIITAAHTALAFIGLFGSWWSSLGAVVLLPIAEIALALYLWPYAQ